MADHQITGNAPGLGPFCTVCGSDGPWDETDPCTNGTLAENLCKLFGAKDPPREFIENYYAALASGEPHHPPWHPCGTWADHYIPELESHYGKCPNCPLEPGDTVTAFGKPGTVRWVTPWGAVAVVFEDEQMHWFRAEAVGAIEQRDA